MNRLRENGPPTARLAGTGTQRRRVRRSRARCGRRRGRGRVRRALDRRGGVIPVRHDDDDPTTAGSVAADELAIPGYDSLAASQVVQRLDGLTAGSWRRSAATRSPTGPARRSSARSPSSSAIRDLRGCPVPASTLDVARLAELAEAGRRGAGPTSAAACSAGVARGAPGAPRRCLPPLAGGRGCPGARRHLRRRRARLRGRRAGGAPRRHAPRVVGRSTWSRRPAASGSARPSWTRCWRGAGPSAAGASTASCCRAAVPSKNFFERFGLTARAILVHRSLVDRRGRWRGRGAAP